MPVPARDDAQVGVGIDRKVARDLGNQAAIDSYKTRQKNLDAKRLATPESF